MNSLRTARMSMFEFNIKVLPFVAIALYIAQELNVLF